MTKLATIHPHRDKPRDIAYKTAREFSFCLWCRFHCHESGQEWEPTRDDGHGRYVDGHKWVHAVGRHYHACSNRQVITLDSCNPDRVMHCSKFNNDGSCEFFVPSRLTRWLRYFRFGRAPVYRSQGEDL